MNNSTNEPPKRTRSGKLTKNLIAMRHALGSLVEAGGGGNDRLGSPSSREISQHTPPSRSISCGQQRKVPSRNNSSSQQRKVPSRSSSCGQKASIQRPLGAVGSKNASRNGSRSNSRTRSRSNSQGSMLREEDLDQILKFCHEVKETGGDVLQNLLRDEDLKNLLDADCIPIKSIEIIHSNDMQETQIVV
jgi:hypothetical protein